MYRRDQTRTAPGQYEREMQCSCQINLCENKNNPIN